ncbi:MAG: cyclic nucleotide-binding domain-containing protein, partial [Candidatus Marinimicrobia bacterium]|nr:cyclic nucleotide-binding domain-containing protein [Candidatus Neomarinimicrobiota bacterium]
MALRREQIRRNLNPGDIIFNEGDHGDAMFVIESGKVEILKDINGEVVQVGTAGDGEIIGEMALIDGSHRSATAKALTAVTLLTISQAMFKQRMADIPAWMQSFYGITVERLRQTTANHKNYSGELPVDHVVQLLGMILAVAKQKSPDESLSVPWQPAAKQVAHLLGLQVGKVVMVMEVLSRSPFAACSNEGPEKSFKVASLTDFLEFVDYCQDISSSASDDDHLPSTHKSNKPGTLEAYRQ